MKANYNVTGEDRRQMVQIISRETGVKAVYTRMPECAFVINNMKSRRPASFFGMSARTRR